ncbi:MAG: hypothetical protein KDK71_03990 [Chlamydiia bacterium]|nr:hypothetical protein [Chlamydiia bacterium]
MANLINAAGKSAFAFATLGALAYNARKEHGQKKAVVLAATLIVGGHVLTQLAMNGRSLSVAQGALSSLIGYEAAAGIGFAFFVHNQSTQADQAKEELKIKREELKHNEKVEDATQKRHNETIATINIKNALKEAENEIFNQDMVLKNLTEEARGQILANEFEKVNPKILILLKEGREFLVSSQKGIEILTGILALKTDPKKIGLEPRGEYTKLNFEGKELYTVRRNGTQGVPFENVGMEYKPVNVGDFTAQSSILNAPPVPEDYDPEAKLAGNSKLLQLAAKELGNQMPEDIGGKTQEWLFKRFGIKYFSDPDPKIVGTKEDPRFAEKLTIKGKQVANPYYRAKTHLLEGAQDDKPLNPSGKTTGARGKGAAGKYGDQNEAVDGLNLTVEDDGIYLMAGTRRLDLTNNVKDLPCFSGGMKEPGADVMKTFTAEVSEEALKGEPNNPEHQRIWREINKPVRDRANAKVDNFVTTYECRPSGDPRDTDDAEFRTTVLANILDPEDARAFVIQSGDDMANAGWKHGVTFASGKTFAEHNKLLVLSMLNPKVITLLLKKYPDKVHVIVRDMKKFAALAKQYKIVADAE